MMNRPTIEWFKNKVMEFAALVKEEWEEEKVRTAYDGTGDYKAYYKPSYPYNDKNDVEITYTFKNENVRVSVNSHSDIAALIIPEGEEVWKLPEKCGVIVDFEGFDRLFTIINERLNKESEV